MADLLSLSAARKAKARAAKEQAATENRVKFGRTRADKDAAKAREELRLKRLDDLKREP
jgi:hypothetical protein